MLSAIRLSSSSDPAGAPAEALPPPAPGSCRMPRPPPKPCRAPGPCRGFPVPAAHNPLPRPPLGPFPQGPVPSPAGMIILLVVMLRVNHFRVAPEAMNHPQPNSASSMHSKYANVMQRSIITEHSAAQAAAGRWSFPARGSANSGKRVQNRPGISGTGTFCSLQPASVR